MKINKYKKGFTLLEILLVIAAIGILAAIVLIAINPNRQIAQARDTVRQSDINTLQKALDQYLIDNKAYPTSISTTPGYICNTASLQTGGPACTGFVDLKVLVPDYIAAIPRDPQAIGDNAGYIVAIAPNNKISVTASLAERKAIVNNPFTVPSGLVLNLDAGNTASYPGTGTTWFDLSGNNNNGTLTNGPTYSSANGGSIVFDGTDDYILITQTLSTPFTITGFVRYTDQAKRMNMYMNTNPHTVLGISLNRTGIGDLYVYIGNGSGWWGTPSIVSSTNMIVNRWYQITFTSTGSGSILYLDGVNVGTSVHSPSGWGSSYYLGGAIEVMRGNIATTQIYNRALSTAEVQQNFNAMRGRYGL